MRDQRPPRDYDTWRRDQDGPDRVDLPSAGDPEVGRMVQQDYAAVGEPRVTGAGPEPEEEGAPPEHGEEGAREPDLSFAPPGEAGEDDEVPGEEPEGTEEEGVGEEGSVLQCAGM